MSLASEKKYLSEAGFGRGSEYPMSWTGKSAVLVIKEQSTWLNQILSMWLELQEIVGFRRPEKISTNGELL